MYKRERIDSLVVGVLVAVYFKICKECNAVPAEDFRSVVLRDHVYEKVVKSLGNSTRLEPP